MQVMAQCWKRWIGRSSTKTPYSPELPLWVMTYVNPGGPWRNLQSWKELGLEKIGQLFRNQEPLQYSTLRDEYDLPQGDFLMHGALMATIRSHWNKGVREPHTHSGLTYIITSTGKFKAITCLYKALQSDVLQPLDRLREQWETDLGDPIDQKRWDDVVKRTYKVSRNARFKLISFYTLHRAYLSPDKINKYFHRSDARCPRCSVENANFLHMIWNCPHNTDYWQEVSDTLARITERAIPCTPLSCLLHDFSHTAKNKTTSKFLDLALVLALREITRNWKSKRGPQCNKWRDEVIKWATCEGKVIRRERRQKGKPVAADGWDTMVTELQDLNNPEKEEGDLPGMMT